MSRKAARQLLPVQIFEFPGVKPSAPLAERRLPAPRPATAPEPALLSPSHARLPLESRLSAYQRTVAQLLATTAPTQPPAGRDNGAASPTDSVADDPEQLAAAGQRLAARARQYRSRAAEAEEAYSRVSTALDARIHEATERGLPLLLSADESSRALAAAAAADEAEAEAAAAEELAAAVLAASRAALQCAHCDATPAEPPMLPRPQPVRSEAQVARQAVLDAEHAAAVARAAERGRLRRQKAEEAAAMATARVPFRAAGVPRATAEPRFAQLCATQEELRAQRRAAAAQRLAASEAPFSFADRDNAARAALAERLAAEREALVIAARTPPPLPPRTATHRLSPAAVPHTTPAPPPRPRTAPAQAAGVERWAPGGMLLGGALHRESRLGLTPPQRPAPALRVAESRGQALRSLAALSEGWGTPLPAAQEGPAAAALGEMTWRFAAEAAAAASVLRD